MPDRDQYYMEHTLLLYRHHILFDLDIHYYILEFLISFQYHMWRYRRHIETIQTIMDNLVHYMRLNGQFLQYKSLQDLQKTLDFTLKPLSHNEPNHLNTN